MHSADSVGERGHAKMAGFFSSVTSAHATPSFISRSGCTPSTTTRHCPELGTVRYTKQTGESLVCCWQAARYLLATGHCQGTTCIRPQLCLVKGSLRLFLISVEIISYVSGNNIFYSSIYHRTERKGLTHKFFLRRRGKVSGISPLCCFLRTKLFYLVLNISQGGFMLGNEQKSS